MTRVFADTAFYVALLNRTDAFHTQAREFSLRFNGQVVTTEYVLVELGNWLARSEGRDQFKPLVQELYDDPQATIVPAEHSLLDAAIGHYDRRPDKAWSLTDCTSFVVMERLEIADAVTTGRHFQQAGFNTLLLKT